MVVMNLRLKIITIISLCGFHGMASLAVFADESGFDGEYRASTGDTGDQVVGWHAQSDAPIEIPYGAACDSYDLEDKGDGLGRYSRFSTGPAVQLPAEIRDSTNSSHYEIVVERQINNKNNKNLDVSVSGSIRLEGC